MKAKDAKNIVDSAHPRPAQVDRLSEKEKKAMELAGTIEHTMGRSGASCNARPKSSMKKSSPTKRP
jgi:hypothetical protein